MKEEVDQNTSANCGIAGSDDNKLLEESDNFQEEHREQNKESKRKRRSDRLRREKELFEQPGSSHLGDCPICCLPIPLTALYKEETVFHDCCSKTICLGCVRKWVGNGCPFCRTWALDDEEYHKRKRQRIEANDPAALWHLGMKRGNEGDYEGANKYYAKAAELGDLVAHYQLSVSYREGMGVEKDEKMEVYHLEKAAIGGHPWARHNLGDYERRHYNMSRAVKHWKIAAILGLEFSMNMLREVYEKGNMTKVEYEETLHAYKAAVDAAKSPQREEAYQWWESIS